MSTTTRDETTIDRWTKDAQFFEYSKAANPIGSGLTSKVPLADFPHHLHEEGPTRIIPFDLSEQLRCPGPATSPALCANFIRILAGERLETRPDATSEVYYVIRGRGRSRLGGGDLPWQEGDFFALPAGSRAEHHAETDAAFYWVHDEPLLRYLGVKADAPRFEPTLYPREQALAVLHEIEQDPKAAQRSRVSVLLANRNFDQTRTITHVIWTMFGVLPNGAHPAPAPPRVRGAGLHHRLPAGLLHLDRTRPRRRREDHQPAAGRLGAGIGVRHAAGPLARAL